jgi:hypothetical protein
VTGSRIEIDRLALRVPWLEAEHGSDLARHVADSLVAAGAADGNVVADRLGVSVAGRAGEGVDELAGRIVEALARQLRLTSR